MHTLKGCLVVFDVPNRKGCIYSSDCKISYSENTPVVLGTEVDLDHLVGHVENVERDEVGMNVECKLFEYETPSARLVSSLRSSDIFQIVGTYNNVKSHEDDAGHRVIDACDLRYVSIVSDPVCNLHDLELNQETQSSKCASSKKE